MEQQLINEITVSYNPKFNDTTNEYITASEKAYQQVLKFFNQDTMYMQEQFVVLYLNRANKVLGGYSHSTGGITGTIADIRIILSIALKTLATGIILSHNHPSERLIPSEEDKRLTKKIKEAGNLIDITVFDHLIVSPSSFYSFADEGIL